MPAARAQPGAPMIYRAVVPPPGTCCDHHTCATLALVRVVFPRSRFDADGREPGDATLRNGHHVTDTTGDPRQLLREFPGWRIFRSDLGRLYAARPGTTVYGWLTAQLRAEIRTCQVGRDPAVPGGPVVAGGSQAQGDTP